MRWQTLKAVITSFGLQLDCLTNVWSQTSQRTKINKVTDLLIYCVVMINVYKYGFDFWLINDTGFNPRENHGDTYLCSCFSSIRNLSRFFVNWLGHAMLVYMRIFRIMILIISSFQLILNSICTEIRHEKQAYFAFFSKWKLITMHWYHLSVDHYM